MATRKALVEIYGQVQELPIGDVLDSGNSSGTAPNRGGLAYVDFGTTPKRSTTLTVLCDWVSSDNSLITLKPNATGTLKNDSDEHLYGEFALKAVNIVDGVSFDILMESNNRFGMTGEFRINWSVIN